MAIIKNEPVFEFKDEDYCKPRHIIVEGSYEEIGYDLGTIARDGETDDQLLEITRPRRIWHEAPQVP